MPSGKYGGEVSSKLAYYSGLHNNPTSTNTSTNTSTTALPPSSSSALTEAGEIIDVLKLPQDGGYPSIVTLRLVDRTRPSDLPARRVGIKPLIGPASEGRIGLDGREVKVVEGDWLEYVGRIVLVQGQLEARHNAAWCFCGRRASNAATVGGTAAGMASAGAATSAGPMYAFGGPASGGRPGSETVSRSTSGSAASASRGGSGNVSRTGSGSVSASSRRGSGAGSPQMPNFSRLSRASSVSQTQQVPQVLQQFQPQPQMQPQTQTQSRPQSSQEPQGIHNRYLRGAIGNVYAVRPLEVPDIGNNQTAAQQIQQLDGQQHPVQPLRFMDVPEDWARSAGLTELLMRGVDLDAV